MSYPSPKPKASCIKIDKPAVGKGAQTCASFVQQVVALPWSHDVSLLSTFKFPERFCYGRHAVDYSIDDIGHWNHRCRGVTAASPSASNILPIDLA